MKKEQKKPQTVERPNKYGEKLKFDGSFEDLLNLSLKNADEEVKKKDAQKKQKSKK